MKSWSSRIADHEVARWPQALLLAVLGCFLLLLQMPSSASATPTGGWHGEVQLDEHLGDAAGASTEIELTRGSDAHGDIGLLSMADHLDLRSAALPGDVAAISSGKEPVGQELRPSLDLVAPNSARFFAGNGPLDEAVAATFRSGTYDEVVLSQDTLLYRIYGGEAGPIGGYWSRTAPSGPMQAQMDSALNPAWGNLATDASTIQVPAGTTIYEGAAAAQPLTGGGSLLGGRNQVFIPRVDSAWLVGG